MGSWVEYSIKTDGKYKYISDNSGHHIFWLKDNDEVWSTDGKNKCGFLKWYKDNWYEIKGINYLAYVQK